MAQGTELEQLYTIEEFEQLPQFNERYELIEGRLVEKAMPGFEHSEIADAIRLSIKDFDRAEQLGLMRHEVRVKIGQQVFVPDLSYWIAERRPARRASIAVYPDWAIEVQSPGQTQASLEAKARTYLAAGVRLVWLVYPDKETVVVMSQGQTQVVQGTGTLDGGEVLPDFRIELSELFKQD